MTATLLDELIAACYPEAEERIRAAIDTLAGDVARQRPSAAAWTERDVWLITYPDQFGAGPDGSSALAHLGEVFERHLGDVMGGVHVLPMYPWSSDDGYSVIDHHTIDERYGSWSDIEELGRGRHLMLDAVVNHLSSEGPWFRGFLDGDPRFADFFYVPDPDADLSLTARPRTTPLVHRFEGRGDVRDVWTTFSRDQVDLDYRNSEVFVAVLSLLYDLAGHGASTIRLDAVSYLWKEPGTASINRPEGHRIIRLLRACLDVGYPDVALITETNVPHDENIAYLGDGAREAQAVYQFALPPLVLHTMLGGDATALQQWAARLEPPPPGTTYFNFLASHDGVGVRPVEGILQASDIDAMVAAVEGGGGLVSSRQTPYGPQPYELNATWAGAVAGGTDQGTALARHLASHAVMLSMRGIAGVYVHSMFATPNDVDGARRSGSNRAINRQRFADDPFASPPSIVAAETLSGMRSMLLRRIDSDAFHPDADQTVLDTPPGVFGIERRGWSSAARVYVNVSSERETVDVAQEWRTASAPATPIELSPYESLWLCV